MDRVIHLTFGHPRYGEFVSQVTEPELAAIWRQHADGAHETGIQYMASMTAEGVFTAWAGYRFEDHENGLGILRVCNMFERPGFRRQDGHHWMFPLVLMELARQVISPHRGLAYCFSYGEPKPLLEALGFQVDPAGTFRTGVDPERGASWWRMVRFPS